MRATRVLGGAVLASCFLLLACAEKQKAASPDVDRIWRKHESIIETALRSHKYNEDELLGAISFFEKTTGIKSPRGWDEVGQVVVPTNDLPKDLERWRAWYVEHQQFLYVDATTGELRLRPRAGP